MRDLPSQTFCILPWVHTHVDTNGGRRFCCHDSLDQKFVGVSLKDFWNGETSKNVRLKMLRGERVEECSSCFSNISKENKNPRDLANDSFYDSFSHLVSNTTATGELNSSPVSYDYRLSNKCNLACIICGPLVSSRIEADYKAQNIETYYQEYGDLKKFEEEILSAISKHEVKYLYWAGGEPLLSETHWAVFKKISELQSFDEISEIIYNSNFSLPHARIKELKNHLEKISKYKIFASLDGVGAVGEFLRTGLIWRNFQENINEFEKKNFIIDITVTIPSLLHLKNLIDYTVTNELLINVRLISFVDASVVLSPLNLPKIELELIVNDLRKYIFVNYGVNLYTSEYLNFLNRLLKSERPSKEYGLLPKIHKDSAMRLLEHLEVPRKNKDASRLSYSEVLSLNENVLLWWHKKIGVEVVNSDLKNIRGRYNQSFNCRIAHMGMYDVVLVHNFFSSVRLLSVGVSGLEINKSSFCDVSIKKGSFKNCRIKNSDFNNVTFEDCHFDNCSFENIKIENRDLKNLSFKNQVITEDQLK